MARSETPGAIRPLTPALEQSIDGNPLLNIDTFLIPSPYVRDPDLEKDREHSYVWLQEGEILGYVLVYTDVPRQSFLIYKLVTSPFVRGRGIGGALITHLLESLPHGAAVYLYIWEKQRDSLDFFLRRGFVAGESVVYRNLVFRFLSGVVGELTGGTPPEGDESDAVREEIGRTRHDARKTIRFLSHMVDMLAIDNCGRIIEDINRETTSLVNTLNAFRDSMSRSHEVNVVQLILERIVPYVGGSMVNCELRLKLQKTNLPVLGNHVSFARAFINIVANALEAIEASGRPDGIMEIKIGEEQGVPYVRFRDNGIGMTAEQLAPGADGIPAFVGRTTKTRQAGEGLGTVQIYSTFGVENISVDGRPNRGCTWRITLRKPLGTSDPWYSRMEQRYHDITTAETAAQHAANTESSRVSYVWHTRTMEIFLFDVILHFSTHHNIRTVFRSVFSYLMGDMDTAVFSSEVLMLRTDHPVTREWLSGIAERVARRWRQAARWEELQEVHTAGFHSYGQARENIIIFTLNPETGRYFATDRKLAEHVDFAPYLGGVRDDLLRGEFNGDVKDVNRAILLGVWTIDSAESLDRALRRIRAGARALLALGVPREKQLAFYQTTYIRWTRDLDSEATTTVGAFAELRDDQLAQYTREAEDELQGFLMGLD